MSTVTLFVLSTETRSERRFSPHLTVRELKTKLEPVTGIPAPSQKITLHASEDSAQALASLDDDDRPLGYYSVRDFQVLKIQDTNPSSTSLAGQYTDVSRVEKFEISKEEYEQRRDTVLAYKQRNHMGRFAPEKKSAPKVEEHVDIPIGSRCQVDPGDGSMKKLGAVRFVGETKFGGGGVWVGVEYDEPLGKNDGSVQGERYFACKPSYGAFVRPGKVQVGDFPPEDIMEDEEEI
ncbi:hypothetical protein SISSUDRAFT_1062206 [Sistotremastrum suecicum HHB10207 ss-3]|uniref:CAP-Gly domain-containing protein n=1 Tax=Sistotremastrum suecicum HHB10207 ss-3 TaxID=1314776 RepID=A0A166D6F1_9AGAM|nr:hypothetical protein SISSUDRAFT_1062206 [Sistotremastrum suecicum HHB10207 ss-3]